MNLDEKTAETLAMIKKATTTGITSGTGIFGYDLGDLISLVPAPSTYFDMLARTAPTDGNPWAVWRALLNVNNAQPNPSMAFDYAAPLTSVSELDVSSPYAKIGSGYTVTQDAINFAKGYADAHSIQLYQSMNQFKIGADKLAFGAQRYALATPGTPSTATATTGGTVAANTYIVKVAARTGSNFNYGGSTVASAGGSQVTTGATSTLTAKVAWVPGAIAYDWYVNGFYNTTTTVNTITWTTTPPASNQPVPNIPGICSTAPTAVPTVDSSANANNFNGLFASLTGDYATGGAMGQVTNGTGLSCGANNFSLDGAGFTVTGQNVAELDELNALIWNSVYLSPTAYMGSAATIAEISQKISSTATGGTTFFTPNNAGERQSAIAGAFFEFYVNKSAGGQPVPFEVHPNMPNGVLVARTDQVNFPNSNITNTTELRCLQDVTDFQYDTGRNPGVAGGGPRFDGEVYMSAAYINRAPSSMGAIFNIA